MAFKDVVIDNYSNGKLFEYLKNKLMLGTKASFVSAYFTIYAYYYLRDELDKIKELRFLFGEPKFIKKIIKDNDYRPLAIEDSSLIIPIKDRLEQKKISQLCSQWIKDKVEIKSIKKSSFLHGKAYCFEKEYPDRKVFDAVIGSSNFTYSGLGFGNNPNMELNLRMSDERDIEEVLDWFNKLWNDNDLVEDVKDKVIKYIEQLYAENAPEFIYYKSLFHIFEDFLSEERQDTFLKDQTGFLDSETWNSLYAFQKDAVKGAINKINRFGGCIIADSVGLGKTFEALAIIKYFELRNCRVLVLCPKKLRGNWTVFRENYDINPYLKDRFAFDVLSHTDLTRTSGKSGNIELDKINWGNYDLVVIDESHNFRNNKKGQEKDEVRKYTRYERLIDNVIKNGVKTKVLLLSATPVNNYLKDLRNQIYLITEEIDSSFTESLGIKSIEQTMRNAQLKFQKWANDKHKDKLHSSLLMESLDSSFFKLLDAVTIARSRKHITQYYKDTIAEFGKFPERAKSIAIFPDIDTLGKFPSYDKLYKSISKFKLSLYHPSKYLDIKYREKYDVKGIRKDDFDNQATREKFLIAMMRINFLKRLESSIKSFEITMKRTIDKIDRLINKIGEYQSKEETGELYEIEMMIDSNMVDDDDFEQMQEMLTVGKKLKFELKHLNLDKWLKGLKEDREHLSAIYNEAKAITPSRDAKLRELKKLIKGKIENPINPKNSKVLLFTAFFDTADYLYKNLKDWYQSEFGLDLAVVSGGKKNNRTTFHPKLFPRQTDFDAILTNFSPIAKKRHKIKIMPQEGGIDLLIATDCISEGQNLQDCDYLINYDIHWNPVRIIQRFGRIDRLGSINEIVQLVNFWPTEDLNNYIRLKDRVEARMALVDITATAEDNLLESDQIESLLKDDIKYRDKQLLRLKDEILDLEEMDENISLTDFTLDDFRIELLNYIQNNREKLESAPLGLYAVVPHPSAN
ncbi:MAG: helicase-related protein, partial [Candidatus Stygibacter australis]|nr:helicase-related protein [Candidatus Stygibacter australis]